MYHRMPLLDVAISKSRREGLRRRNAFEKGEMVVWRPNQGAYVAVRQEWWSRVKCTREDVKRTGLASFGEYCWHEMALR